VTEYWASLTDISSFKPEHLFPVFCDYADRLLDAAASKLLERGSDDFRGASMNTLREVAMRIVEDTRPFPARRVLRSSGYDVELCSNVPHGEWERCLQTTGVAAGFDSCLGSGNTYALRERPYAYQFERRLVARLTNRGLHWKAEFLKAAREQSQTVMDKAASAPNKPPARRGYREEVRQWMKSKGLRTLPDAAKRLVVGVDTLKSIMSNKGNKRYGDATLRDVLKKIGHPEP
jgi:hypothetical protein